MKSLSGGCTCGIWDYLLHSLTELPGFAIVGGRYSNSASVNALVFVAYLNIPFTSSYIVLKWRSFHHVAASPQQRIRPMTRLDASVTENVSCDLVQAPEGCSHVPFSAFLHQRISTFFSLPTNCTLGSALVLL